MSQPDLAPVRDRDEGTLAAVLARPQFMLLTVGQTVSQLGDRLHNMALIALVAAAAAEVTTGVEVSKIGVVTLLPTLLAPVIGAMVDRWNKRFTMIASHLLRAVAVVLIPWLYFSLGYIWPVYVVAFIVGLGGVFFNAAKMALIPDLVEHRQLLPANAALSTIGRFATVAGIVGGGFMVSWDGWQRIGWEGWEAGFYMDAASYMVSVFTLVGIAWLSRADERKQEAHHPLSESAAVVKERVEHIADDMKQTFRLIRSHHGLRFVFLMVVVLGALAGSIFNLLTASSLALLGVGPKGVGILGGLLAGGMIVGSLLVGTVGARWDKRWMMVLGCLFMGLFMLGGSIWFSYQIFLPISFAGGMVLAPVMVSMDTLLHEWTPRATRGLVFSSRDLVLGAAFMTFNTAAGAAVVLLGRMAETPYAVALFVFGIVVMLGSLVAASTQLRLRHLPGPEA